MFETGDYVVYGSTGVCVVDEIKEMKNPMTGDPCLYYVMHPAQDKSGVLYLPTSNTKVVMRSIMTKEEADQLVLEVSQIEELDVPDERKREQRYKEALKTCDARDCVRILKTLYTRREERLADGKKVTALDERYIKLSEKGLYEELSISLGIPKEEVREYLFGQLGE